MDGCSFKGDFRFGDTMPNIGGQKFPYTPAGMAAAKRAQMAQSVPAQEVQAIDRSVGDARTEAQRRLLRKRLGMVKRPTTADPRVFGDYEV